ncbi:alpha-amylase family glycosyl hydrolase [Halobacillus sp. B29]|uniref:alpha-amylase family glycosyl hydrolase n=1 Tax=Halobacillus sp. B29 TaxID=3457432 RepID=UPI003FCE9D43
MRKVIAGILFIPLFLFFASQAGAAEIEERQWQDESVYYISIDRFMNGDNSNDREEDEAYHGGDLEGIIKQLDYIKEKGFTAIEISPMMANQDGGYHGQWIDDFQSVDEHFGTMKKAEELVEAAHELDLKVMFDFVVSHTGSDHPWKEDPQKNDWYAEGDTTLPEAWTENMSVLNLDNPQVQSYFLDTAEFWIKETGVDAFHLHSAVPLPDKFYTDLEERVQSVQEGFGLFTKDLKGEDDSSVSFQSVTRDTFQSSGKNLDDLYTVWEDNLEHKGKPYETLRYIDDPSIGRFTHLAVEEGQNPITRWKLALTYQFTIPGIPVMYFGTELPLDDGGDPSTIKMMNFKAGDEQLKQRIDNLTSMRTQFPALTRGDYEEMYNEEGLAIFKRSYEDQTMIVAINNAEETKAAVLSGLPEGQQLRGLLHDGMVRQQDNGDYRLGMERETADVFVVEPDEGYNWLFIGFVGGVLSLFVIAVTVISLKNRKTEHA